MIKHLTIILACGFMAGCAGLPKKADLREPTCMESVVIAVKTQTMLADTAASLRQAGLISSGAKEEVSKSLNLSVSFTDSAEQLCEAEAEDMAKIALEKAVDIYKDACTSLKLTEKSYCKVLQ